MFCTKWSRIAKSLEESVSNLAEQSCNHVQNDDVMTRNGLLLSKNFLCTTNSLTQNLVVHIKQTIHPKRDHQNYHFK